MLGELQEVDLLHFDEVLLAQAELVLCSGVELVQVAHVPSVLVIRRVQLNLLTGNIELVAVAKGDEVGRHYFVANFTEDCFNEGRLFVFPQSGLSLFDLVCADLGKM